MTDLVGFDALAPGLRIHGIHYDVHAFEVPSSASAAFEGASAVSIDFGPAGVARFHWRFHYPNYEDLWIGPAMVGEPQRAFRVDRTARWELAGATLQGHAVARQETDGGGPGVLTPCACRLDFDGDRHLVIALGERTEDSLITYLPDSLIITDSREIACSYRPLAARETAWCSPC